MRSTLRSMFAGLATFGLAGGGVAAASTTGSPSASAGHPMIVMSKVVLPSTNRALPDGVIETWIAANGLTAVATTFSASGREVGVERTTVTLAPCPIKEYACSANVAGTHITPMKLVRTDTVVFPSEHAWAQVSGSTVCGYQPSCAKVLSQDGNLGPYVTPSWIEKDLATHFFKVVGQPSEISGQHAVQVVAATDPDTNTWIDPTNDEILRMQALPNAPTWNFEWFAETTQNSQHLDLGVLKGYHRVANSYVALRGYVTTAPSTEEKN